MGPDGRFCCEGQTACKCISSLFVCVTAQTAAVLELSTHYFMHEELVSKSCTELAEVDRNAFRLSRLIEANAAARCDFHHF